MPELDEYDINTLLRIKAKLLITDAGCWEFQGCRNRQGYGTVGYRGRICKAHRVTYRLLVGEIPASAVIDHFVCDNPPCCNPDHLRPVTQRQNVLRGTGLASANTAKLACHIGHEFTPENTDVRPNGKRRCRACYRAKAREYYANKKSAPVRRLRHRSGASTGPQEVQS